MAEQINFLLGYGERLTAPVTIDSGGRPKLAPYLRREGHPQVGARGSASGPRRRPLGRAGLIGRRSLMV